MSELLKLAERCEAATGPDRELDLDVFQIETGKPFRWAEFGGAFGKIEGDDLVLAVEVFPFDSTEHEHQFRMSREREIVRVPAYTASLDAAMTLVPEGAWDHMEAYRPDHQDLGWTVWLLPNANTDRDSFRGFAQSYALALCAAALRARGATNA